jgi:cardiolipin synthase
MISTVGKVLDPFADKLTQFTLAICLAVQFPVVWVMVGLIFIKEIFQLIAGIIMFRKGKMLKGALMAGKVCTAVLFLSLIMLVLTPAQQLTEKVVTIVTIVDVVFLLISFISYAMAYYKRSPMIQDFNDQAETA